LSLRDNNRIYLQTHEKLRAGKISLSTQHFYCRDALMSVDRPDWSKLLPLYHFRKSLRSRFSGALQAETGVNCYRSTTFWNTDRQRCALSMSFAFDDRAPADRRSAKRLCRTQRLWRCGARHVTHQFRLAAHMKHCVPGSIQSMQSLHLSMNFCLFSFQTGVNCYHSTTLATEGRHFNLPDF
jgi:hypothetical protein